MPAPLAAGCDTSSGLYETTPKSFEWMFSQEKVAQFETTHQSRATAERRGVGVEPNPSNERGRFREAFPAADLSCLEARGGSDTDSSYVADLHFDADAGRDAGSGRANDARLFGFD